MKRTILLSFLIISFSVHAQESDSTSYCRADFKFAVNPNIYTLLPATAIDFFDKSEGDVIAWFWDFGDNNTSTEQNPMFIFNHPLSGPDVKINPYRNVRLTITTSDSCTSSTTQTINIMDVAGDVTQTCKAVFKYYEMSRDSVAGTAKIHFDNYSEGKEMSYLWQFGDGTVSTEKDPEITFKTEQYEYKVCLTVNGTDSCSSTFCDAVYLENPDISPEKCEVRFGYDVMDILMNPFPSSVLNFYYKSYPEAAEWYWDFGDGTTSNEPNPVHEYIQYTDIDSVLGDPNPYREVCLTIITVDGCKVTYCEKIDMFGINPPLPEPDACIALFKYYESGRDTVGGTAKIVFNNYSEGKDLKYLWQFGDGSTSTEKEPVVKFSLNQPEYKVCLTTTSADSCINTFCDIVYLHYPIIIDTIMPDCYVDFKYERKDILMSPLPSVAIYFYSRSYPEAKEWYWDFGDGTTSNEPNPTHIYIKPMINDSMKVMYNPFRTICLTVLTGNDCKITTCQTIQVFDYDPQPEPEKCQVYFKYYQPDDILSIPEVVPIRLVDVSEGDVISRHWYFEDGSESTEKEPLATFNIFQPVHKVCLTVTFADSCTNTFCDYVYLNSGITDTVVVDPVCQYYIKVDGGFPPEMSSCAGWASAKVYLGEELVEPAFISWSTGDTLSKVEGLCPTETYTVKALMPDGCAVWVNFILSADGSVMPVSPVNWWLSGEREKLFVRSDAAEGMNVVWRLCDGTLVDADSIPLDAINCGDDMSNMIVTDSLGNVVYSETISLKGSVTGIEESIVQPTVKLWPNPVSSKLNIRYSGEYQAEIDVEIFDVTGKMITAEIFSNVLDGSVFNVNTELLKQGIYICRISAKGKTLTSEKFSRQ